METIVSFPASALHFVGACAQVPKVWLTYKLIRRAQNAEIFTLTYGSMVRQLIADLEDIAAVNKQLDEM